MKNLTHLIFIACCLTLGACSKNSSQDKNVQTETQVNQEVSQECKDYMQLISELSQEDETLKEQLKDNLDQVNDEWGTLSAEDQKIFSENCATMTQQLKKIQELSK